MEFIKDYNCSIYYHSDNANVVADALTWKAPRMRKGIHDSSNDDEKVTFASIWIQSTIVDQIKVGQQQNPQYESLNQKAIGEETDWNVDDARILKYKGKLWVPEELHKEVMKQAHESSYTMHPRTIKMSQDLKIY